MKLGDVSREALERKGQGIQVGVFVEVDCLQGKLSQAFSSISVSERMACDAAAAEFVPLETGCLVSICTIDGDGKVATYNSVLEIHFVMTALEAVLYRIEGLVSRDLLGATVLGFKKLKSRDIKSSSSRVGRNI